MAHQCSAISLTNDLSSLYRENGLSVSLVAPTLSQGSKFVYHIETGEEPTAGTKAEGIEPSSEQIKLKSVLAQQIAFCAGSMPVFLFDLQHRCDCFEDPLSQSARKQALRTLSAIDERQRPQLSFFRAPKFIQVCDVSAPLAICTPSDDFDRLPRLIDQETLYELLTKESLADSSIPTPKGFVIQVDLPLPDLDIEASDRKRNWISGEIKRITKEISGTALPYVLKFTQTISGCGVHIVQTNVQHQKLLAETLPAALGAHLPHLSPVNAHLKPCNLVLTPLIEHVTSNYSLTFFVNKKGRGWTYNCCGDQHLDGTSYEGTTADYKAQKSLQRKMSKTIDTIADFVSRKGYVGPVGADVLEDGDGKQWVIDLNVRWSSSWALGTLKDHFLRRGCTLARLVYLSIELGLSRRRFLQYISDDKALNDMVVIVGWFEHSSAENPRSYAHIIFGATDESGLSAAAEAVNRIVRHKR